MKYIIKTTAVFIFILALSLGLYYHFRWPFIEQGYIKSTMEKAESIRPAASRITPATTGESLKKFFDALSVNDRALAAIATADMNGNVQQIVKNDSMVHSGRMVDKLINDIKESSGRENSPSGAAISSFTEKAGAGNSYYVFSMNTGTLRFIAVYVFRPEKPLLIRIAMELMLILTAAVMAAAGTAAMGRKKGRPVIQKNTAEVPAKKSVETVKPAKKTAGKKARADNSDAACIDESELFASKYVKEQSITADAAAKDNAGTSAVADALNTVVFELFKKIRAELSPETVSLYMKKTEKRLSKSYELRGKTFLRVDAPVFESILISELAEASRPGAHITEGGTKVRIPLFDSELLVGLVEIILKDSATAMDLGRIQKEVKETSRQIREFIVINNVIVDPATGYYSSSYLNMKLGEQIYSAMKHRSGFCLMVVDLFGGREIDTEQKNTMMKVLLPVVKKATGDRFEIFNLDSRITVILEHMDAPGAERIGKSLEKEISRYRIKLADERLIRLSPAAAYTISFEAENLKDILRETLAKLEKAEVTV